MEKKETNAIKAITEDDFPNIRKFLMHIGRDANRNGKSRYEFLLDYIQLALFRPEQRLPVLILISERREVGRTTFISLLKLVFEGKMTSFGRFIPCNDTNKDYLDSVIIAIDDARLLNTSQQASEYFHMNLCPDLRIVETRHLKVRFIENKTHFVFCSDRFKESFSRYNPMYALFEVYPPLKKDKKLLDRMGKEVSVFITYLSDRILSTQAPESSLYFAPFDYVQNDLPF